MLLCGKKNITPNGLIENTTYFYKFVKNQLCFQKPANTVFEPPFS
jgi:hypothetical protein